MREMTMEKYIFGHDLLLTCITPKSFEHLNFHPVILLSSPFCCVCRERGSDCSNFLKYVEVTYADKT